MSDVHLSTPSHERTGVGRPARTYLQQHPTYTGCCLEDLLNTMDDNDECRKRELRKSVLAARHDDDNDHEKHVTILKKTTT